MKFLNRTIKEQIRRSLVPNKVVVLLGPRRVGKTVLINQILKDVTESYLLLNGEDTATRALFTRRSVGNFLKLLASRKLLVIDEAQKIPDIGNALKLMVDEIEGLRILVTGSSAFDVENYTGEPLTGRKSTYKLYALSEKEYSQVENLLEKKDNLRERLIYGNYPELLQLPTREEKTEYLNEIVNSYLLKDILTFENIRNSNKIISLLRLIAYQIGGLVNIPELATQLQMSRNTVDKYLDLLSKVFIIHRVGGFSRNLRKEITKSSRYYFFDNGLRNVLIANVNPIELRNDIGQLWENYMISERVKFQTYNKMLVNNYFWRTYDQQEIDWVEDRGGKLYGYEFKWSTKKKPKTPGAWANNYPDAVYEIINPNNYDDWINN